MRAGDAVLSWSRAARPRPRQGKVFSALDLVAVEVEEAPRGSVTLQGRRGQQKQSWTLGPGEWGLRARPVLAAEALATRARELAEARQWPEADEA